MIAAFFAEHHPHTLIDAARFAASLNRHTPTDLATAFDEWDRTYPHQAPTPADINATLTALAQVRAGADERQAATRAMRRCRAEHETRKAGWALTRRVGDTPTPPPRREL